MTDEHYSIINVFGRLVRVRWWVCKDTFSCNESGLWPFNVWWYLNTHRWGWHTLGVGLHWLKIADAHFEVSW